MSDKPNSNVNNSFVDCVLSSIDEQRAQHALYNLYQYSSPLCSSPSIIIIGFAFNSIYLIRAFAAVAAALRENFNRIAFSPIR